MQKSCLFFLSACFTATVVLSERIALAPINALTDFVSSNRNAQETDDIFGGFGELMSDENFMECSVDTAKMSESETSAIEAATEAFAVSVVGEINSEFPKEARETYGQVCADNGGYLNELGGTLSCSLEGVSFTFSGYAICFADTKACKAVDVSEMYKFGLELAGAVCDVTDSSDSSDTSAGAGHHWSFNYLALSGMVVGASFF